jgi:hypothetical protein
MESIEMVKCFLARNAGDEGSVRYVPLEIFQLWRFLMERVHRLQVTNTTVSLWVPQEDFDAGEPDAAGAQPEPVIEVKFQYLESAEVGRPVTRYFPEANFDQIYQYFRRHFAEDAVMEGAQHRKGYYLAGAPERPYAFRQPWNE